MNQLEWARKALGVTDKSTPAEIRQSYRDLTQVWHPDRFEGNSRLQLRAEEMLKRLGSAKRILDGENDGTYSKEWTTEPTGSTEPEREPEPEYEYEPEPPRPKSRVRASSVKPESDAPTVDSTKFSPVPGVPSGKDFVLKLSLQSVLIVFVLALIAWPIFLSKSSSATIAPPPKMDLPMVPKNPLENPNVASKQNSVKEDFEQPPAGQNANLEAERDFQEPEAEFKPKKIEPEPKPVLEKKVTPSSPIKANVWSIGSTKDAVLAVEGTPKSVSGDTWFYNDFDNITFDNGVVSSYSNSSNSLKVQLKASSPNKASVWSIGSTKDAVLAVEGTPKSISGDTWFYNDFDNITFDNGVVSSYSNFSNSLKVKL